MVEIREEDGLRRRKGIWEFRVLEVLFVRILKLLRNNSSSGDKNDYELRIKFLRE